MKFLRRLAGTLGLTLLLAGCGAESVWAPDDFVARSAYVPGGAPTVTLLTMIHNGSGAGGHSSLVIDGSQRIIFDPAGSWHHPNIPERNDVLFGMSPVYFDFYMDYHARETYHVVVQELEVSPATAEALIVAVQQYGAVPSAQCAQSVSNILGNTPGFGNIRSTWFPKALMEQFEQIPGVRTSRVYDDDSDDNLEVLQRQARMEQIRAQAPGGN
ncbi:hypothetical protein HKCCE2091_00725 [Rhodobacterales bacterium HKCCE2091]|nr:hypothetical protein [Rhodobacterales bacterium HKCCE2091]